LKNEVLLEALVNTAKKLDPETLDNELHKLVPKARLQTIRGYALPGELAFATPYLLASKPQLIGYYRLLLGISQKKFYDQGGFGAFRSMEERNELMSKQRALLPELCSAINEAIWQLISGIDEKLTQEHIKELTLLTLGAQLRGSDNVRIGANATDQVFQLVTNVLAAAKPDVGERTIRFKNAAGREMVVEFASDPDIRIYEMLSSGRTRKVVSVEIKGGRDVSNLHNRLGEAEKSHLKARAQGYSHFWTIVAFKGFDLEKAKEESPTTNEFFDISEIGKPESSQGKSFREQLLALVGLKSDA
jgi:hypothetical protein